MRRLLWVGDAAVSTGFARCTHHVLEEVRKTWDVFVLGINHQGDPHPYPYPIFPCWPGGDAFGINRIESVVQAVKPDLIVLQNDPWNIPAYLNLIKDIPVVASMPVDGKNFRTKDLEPLALAVFWTDFGLNEARLAGWQGRSAVIPLGVDTDLFHPRDQLAARKAIGLPEYLHDAFIIGNINRNQPRKRLDLTVSYFAEWMERYKHEDAWLYLHVAPTQEDQEYDVTQLMSYYGFIGDTRRLIYSRPEIGHGVNEEELASVYACFDVQMTTTQGEGWGLTTMEGMACGIPQIVPDWAALGEWTGDAALGVKCSEIAVTPNRVNVIGGVADREEMIQGFQMLYENFNGLRQRLGDVGLNLVSDPKYRWPAIGRRFVDELDTIPLPSLQEKSA